MIFLLLTKFRSTVDIKRSDVTLEQHKFIKKELLFFISGIYFWHTICNESWENYLIVHVQRVSIPFGPEVLHVSVQGEVDLLVKALDEH